MPIPAPVSGWPFLVAAGRRRDYSTLLAPAFLVDALDYGALAKQLEPSPQPRPAAVAQIRTGAGRELTVVHATHLLTEADLGAVGGPPRDEHNRPLRLIYGLVLAGDWLIAPDPADLDQVRAAALATYRDFLSHEDTARVVAAPAFPVRSLVTPRTRAAAASVPAAVPGDGGMSRLRMAGMIASVLAVFVAVVATVLVIGNRAATPDRDPCPTVTVAARVVATPTPSCTNRSPGR